MPSKIAYHNVQLLADHLDRILAAGEDLKKLTLETARPSVTETARRHSVRSFVCEAKELEFALAASVMRAREHAKNLARVDIRFAMLATLFIAGTTSVVDAVAELADHDVEAFDNGYDPLEFLRNRDLIQPGTGCLSVISTINIDDSFLLAGEIELGALLDLCAQFLDSLCEQFSLFPQLAIAVDTPRQRGHEGVEAF